MADRCHAAHSRKRRDAGHGALVQRSAHALPIVVVANLVLVGRQRDIHGLNAIGTEPRPLSIELAETLREQRGADRQHQSDRQLTGHQEVLQPAGAAAAPARAGASSATARWPTPWSPAVFLLSAACKPALAR